MNRSPLKWVGSKGRLIGRLRPHLECKRLVEPFVGAGNVFMNIVCDSYLLSDTNADLINMYNQIKEHGVKFIEDLKVLWLDGNDKDVYYKRRTEFNLTEDLYRKGILFIYLNRHGFNGLCRYSKKTGYNVPFGTYKKVYFPKDELLAMIPRLEKCTFKIQSFEETFKEIEEGDKVYCDPPYVPVKDGAFVGYTSDGFGLVLQDKLLECAKEASVDVIVSNSDCDITRKMYGGAKLEFFEVQRNVSRDGKNRNKAGELIAYFKAK